VRRRRRPSGSDRLVPGTVAGSVVCNGAVVDTAIPRGAVARLARTGLPWWSVPLLVYLASRLVGAVVLLVLGQAQEPRVAVDGVEVVDPAGAGPGYLTLTTNWDGQWYQGIVEQGYPTHLPREDGAVAENRWAFYPAYPALVRLLMTLASMPFALAATVVSTGCGALAMVLVYRLLLGRVGRYNALMTVLAVSLSPAALVLQTAYTESLALLLVVVCLSLLAERRYGALAVCILVLALARPVVVPLAAVVALHGWLRWRRRDDEPFPVPERRRLALALLAAAVGSALWPAVAGAVTGEWDAFFATQRAWTSTFPGEPTWLLQVVHHPASRAAVVSLAVCVVTVALVVRRSAAHWGTDLRAWVLFYGGFLLVTAAPVASSLRYAILAVVPWWPLTDETREWGRGKRIAVAASVVVLGVLAQVAWCRLCYVITPDRILFP
jgi:hypothetical protein